MHFRKHFITITLLLLGTVAAQAQSFSYLYIQGDKQTPFYVKLEGEMMPRYGKNYCIISNLAAGPAHIQILFQQNVFPQHDFTVLMPEGGSREFLLTQKDGHYQLYDLQQQFYLDAGNKEEDDKLPSVTAQPARPAQIAGIPAATAQTPNPETPDRKPLKTNDKPVVKKPVTRKPAVIDTSTSASAKTPGRDPAFIDNFELPSPNGNTAGTVTTTPMSAEPEKPVLINSDCPTALSEEAFSKLYNSVLNYKEDEERVAYLNNELPKNCFETWHARTLASALTGDAARFSMLKKIYPRITDQQAFLLLDDMLTTDVWKAAFKKLINPR